MTASLAKFSLGQIVATPGVLDVVEQAGLNFVDLLTRHEKGDWGDVCEADRRLNEDALITGERLWSVYVLPTFVKVWVITEWDRSVTTLLLPEEY